MKLNSEHLFKLATLEINAIWRTQYALRCSLNKNNSNSVTSTLANLSSCTKLASILKIYFYERYSSIFVL